MQHCSFFCEPNVTLLLCYFLFAELQKINDEWKLQVGAFLIHGWWVTPAKVMSADTAAYLCKPLKCLATGGFQDTVVGN